MEQKYAVSDSIEPIDLYELATNPLSQIYATSRSQIAYDCPCSLSISDSNPLSLHSTLIRPELHNLLLGLRLVSRNLFIMEQQAYL